jgi:hypothetical protein
MIPVRWEARHQLQQLLYEAVTDYVREGYNQALRDKKRHVGFLMIPMQRLVVSSTRAIRTTLERRFEVLKFGEKQASQRLDDFEKLSDTTEDYDELYDLDGQELLDELLKSQVFALQNESIYVETLLGVCRTYQLRKKWLPNLRFKILKTFLNSLIPSGCVCCHNRLILFK